MATPLTATPEDLTQLNSSLVQTDDSLSSLAELSGGQVRLTATRTFLLLWAAALLFVSCSSDDGAPASDSEDESTTSAQSDEEETTTSGPSGDEMEIASTIRSTQLCDFVDEDLVETALGAEPTYRVSAAPGEVLSEEGNRPEPSSGQGQQYVCEYGVANDIDIQEMVLIGVLGEPVTQERIEEGNARLGSRDNCEKQPGTVGSAPASEVCQLATGSVSASTGGLVGDAAVTCARISTADPDSALEETIQFCNGVLSEVG